MSEKITLGVVVIDTITGLIGVATSRCESYMSDTQVLVSPKATSDGQCADPQWIAESRLRAV